LSLMIVFWIVKFISLKYYNAVIIGD